MSASGNQNLGGTDAGSLDELLASMAPTMTHVLVKQVTKQRINERLHRRTRRTRGLASFAIIMLLGSVAAAGLRGVFVSQVDSAGNELPPRVLKGAPIPVAWMEAAIAANREPGEPATASTTQAAATETGAARATGGHVASAAGGRRPKSRALSPTRVAAAAGEDPTKVVQALHALRREGRPALAHNLLKRYLTEHPQGCLAEEALALAIEAAIEENPALAANYARRYLKRFPQGRYKKAAKRAVAR